MLSCVCYCTLPRQPTAPFHLASIETTNPLKLDLVQALPSGVLRCLNIVFACRLVDTTVKLYLDGTLRDVLRNILRNRTWFAWMSLLILIVIILQNAQAIVFVAAVASKDEEKAKDAAQSLTGSTALQKPVHQAPFTIHLRSQSNTSRVCKPPPVRPEKGLTQRITPTSGRIVKTG